MDGKAITPYVYLMVTLERRAFQSAAASRDGAGRESQGAQASGL